MRAVVSQGAEGAFEDPSVESHSTEAARTLANDRTLSETSLWPSTRSERRFAAVTIPVGFKIHGTACISLCRLTDRSYFLKGDLKVIL